MVIDRFYFSNGESAGSLGELLEKMKEVDEGCFLHHVNEERNDFGNWIEFCVGQKALGKQVGKLKDRGKIIEVISKKVNTPGKIKESIIAQIKHAILHDG